MVGAAAVASRRSRSTDSALERRKRDRRGSLGGGGDSVGGQTEGPADMLGAEASGGVLGESRHAGMGGRVAGPQEAMLAVAETGDRVRELFGDWCKWHRQDATSDWWSFLQKRRPAVESLVSGTPSLGSRPWTFELDLAISSASRRRAFGRPPSSGDEDVFGPEETCLEEKGARCEATSVWRMWHEWLRAHRRFVNLPPDVLSDTPERLPAPLFQQSFPDLCARLASDRPDEAEIVRAAVAKQPTDLQALAFLHQMASRKFLQSQSADATMNAAASDGERKRRAFLLWNQVVVLQNAPLPLFTRAWLTRSIYENALPAIAPSSVVHTPAANGAASSPELRSALLAEQCAPKFAFPLNAPVANGSGSGRAERWLRWATAADIETAAFGLPVRKCGADVIRAIAESIEFEDAAAGSDGPGRRGIARAREDLAWVRAQRPASEAREIGTPSWKSALASLGAQTVRHGVFTSALDVLLALLHATNCVLQVYTIGAPTWGQVAERDNTRRRLLQQLQINALLPIICQLEMSGIDRRSVNAGAVGLAAARSFWTAALGLAASEFPEGPLRGYFSYGAVRQDLAVADLDADLVGLGQALHLHKLLTLAQTTRAVVLGWKLLWFSLLTPPSPRDPASPVAPTPERARDIWSDQWAVLALLDQLPDLQ